MAKVAPVGHGFSMPEKAFATVREAFAGSYSGTSFSSLFFDSDLTSGYENEKDAVWEFHFRDTGKGFLNE